jgi:hypothetical protein
MNQVNKILQKTSGKIEVILAAMENGCLTEEAQHGVQVMLSDMKADIEEAGAI